MITYLRNNKQWIFSGIGVFTIGIIIAAFKEHSPINNNKESGVSTSQTEKVVQSNVISNSTATNKNSKPRELAKEDSPVKVGGISFAPTVSTQFSYNPASSYYSGSNFRVQPLDMALYSNSKLYLKISVCNVGNAESYLYRPRIWYTPPNGQASINWYWDYIFYLKPNECKLSGAWSEMADETFRLMRPLGSINVAPGDINTFVSSIDLSSADAQGLVQF